MHVASCRDRGSVTHPCLNELSTLVLHGKARGTGVTKHVDHELRVILHVQSLTHLLPLVPHGVVREGVEEVRKVGPTRDDVMHSLGRRDSPSLVRLGLIS